MATSFKVEVRGVGEKTFVSNGLRFATAEEGERYAGELGSRWFGFDAHRVVESDDPVNYFADASGRARPVSKENDIGD